MKISDEAVEAAAEALRFDHIKRWSAPNYQPWPWSELTDFEKAPARADAQVAIEAAMPAIREALAQEIEEHAAYTERQSEGLGRVRAFGSGLRTAARIVRCG